MIVDFEEYILNVKEKEDNFKVLDDGVVSYEFEVSAKEELKNLLLFFSVKKTNDTEVYSKIKNNKQVFPNICEITLKGKEVINEGFFNLGKFKKNETKKIFFDVKFYKIETVNFDFLEEVLGFNFLHTSV